MSLVGCLGHNVEAPSSGATLKGRASLTWVGPSLSYTRPSPVAERKRKKNLLAGRMFWGLLGFQVTLTAGTPLRSHTRLTGKAAA